MKRYICPGCLHPPLLRSFPVRNRKSMVQRYRCDTCMKWYRRKELINIKAHDAQASIAAEVTASEAAFYADEALLQGPRDLHQAAEDARYRRLGLEPGDAIE